MPPYCTDCSDVRFAVSYWVGASTNSIIVGASPTVSMRSWGIILRKSPASNEASSTTGPWCRWNTKQSQPRRVAHRHGHEESGALGDLPIEGHQECCRSDVAVSEQSSLRGAGGAAGIDQQRWGVVGGVGSTFHRTAALTAAS